MNRPLFVSPKVYRVAASERRARRVLIAIGVALCAFAFIFHKETGDVTWPMFSLLIAGFIAPVAAAIVPETAKDPNGWSANLVAAASCLVIALLAFWIYAGPGAALKGQVSHALAILAAVCLFFAGFTRLLHWNERG